MHPLLLATGKRQVVALDHVFQADPGQALTRQPDVISRLDLPGLMGDAAEQHDLLDLVTEMQVGQLRQHGPAAGEFLQVLARQTLAEHLDVTLAAQLAADVPQQRALARAVATDDDDEFTAAQVQAHLAQQRPAGDAHFQLADLEKVAAAHGSLRILRSRSSRYRKNGPPSTAVTIPIGSSAGTMMVRDTRSASMSSSAPSSALAGSSTRWFGPNQRRIRCGTTRPTKPIMPETATPAPTPRATRATMIHLTVSTGTPR